MEVPIAPSITRMRSCAKRCSCSLTDIGAETDLFYSQEQRARAKSDKNRAGSLFPCPRRCQTSVMDPRVKAQIQKAIEENDILLFMKGTRGAPSCGFSARTVEVLESLVPTFATVDVLSHPEIRDGIKEFSSWPTIPQLYVRGNFVGGADIIAELYESGELHSALGVDAEQGSPPSILMTEA